MERKYKVVQVGRGGNQAPVGEEAEELGKVNAELVETDCVSEEEIIEVAQDADVILRAGRAQISRRVMEALPKCQAIVCGTVGFDGIDISAATDDGIIVVNNPAREWCAEEVSNHAIVLLLACAKKLILFDKLTKQGCWSDCKRVQAPMGSIYGQTLGLLACGDIAQMTAKKAQCFGMKTLGYDPYLDESVAKEYSIDLVSLPELLRESDFISVHAPLNERTRHMIGDKELKQMKPSAYLINTARGPIIDEVALIEALQKKWIAGAGLDVFEKEPPDADSPLFKMDNVVVTPHTGAYSDTAFRRPSTIMLQEVVRLLSGRWPKNVLNKTVKPKVDLV